MLLHIFTYFSKIHNLLHVETIFKEDINDIPLPLVLVRTRWETWVYALYYTNYFTKYTKVIERLTMNDVQNIRKVFDIN